MQPSPTAARRLVAVRGLDGALLTDPALVQPQSIQQPQGNSPDVVHVGRARLFVGL
jgi:hypothetical protein